MDSYILDVKSTAAVLGWLPVQALLRNAAVSRVWHAAGFDLNAWEGFRLTTGSVDQGSENSMHHLQGDGLYHVALRLRTVAQKARHVDCSTQRGSHTNESFMQVLPRRPLLAHVHSHQDLTHASPLEVCRYCFGGVEFWFLQYNARTFGYLSDMDTMGLKVWPTCVVFSQYFCCDENAPQLAGKQCLELGAGAGVLSVVLTSLGASFVTTDRDLVSLCVARVNMRLNGLEPAHTHPLSYGVAGVNEFTQKCGIFAFDVILGSDLVYSEHVCGPLFDTVAQLLTTSGSFYLAYELRDEAHQSAMLRVALSMNFSWDEPYAPAEPKSRGIGGTLDAMKVQLASGASLSSCFAAVNKVQRVLVYRFFRRPAVHLNELD